MIADRKWFVSIATYILLYVMLLIDHTASSLAVKQQQNQSTKVSATVTIATTTKIPNDSNNICNDAVLRRQFLRHTFITTISTVTAFTTTISTASAADNKQKSRTDGYDVQHTEREWADILSGAQYNILRRGGTERQRSSILNTFTASDHIGTYVCAACNTALFASADKFPSGTGWPSFASASSSVELEQLDPVSATLNGREARCGTCGGHLGDLFNDGFYYRGTLAAKTNQRYCIDGAALIFKPASGDRDVYGDTPPPNKPIQYQQSLYRDPK